MRCDWTRRGECAKRADRVGEKGEKPHGAPPQAPARAGPSSTARAPSLARSGVLAAVPRSRGAGGASQGVARVGPGLALDFPPGACPMGRLAHAT